MENKNHSGINSGFIVGFLLGIIITLLLTTKRGREILRRLTDKATEKFATLEDILQATEEGIDEADQNIFEDEPEPMAASHQKTQVSSEAKIEKKEAEAQMETKPSPPVKRSARQFFRRHGR